jgi:hypothetical protein
VAGQEVRPPVSCASVRPLAHSYLTERMKPSARPIYGSVGADVPNIVFEVTEAAYLVRDLVDLEPGFHLVSPAPVP